MIWGPPGASKPVPSFPIGRGKPAAPSGRITVSVGQDAKEVTIFVADTGIGIPSEEIPHVFDRFFRADRSRTVAGAGLGLSLVRAVVQKHGGDVRLSSTPGVGTTVTVKLPKAMSSR
jgi:two-component system, OmpR family, sensor histidine kinase BaeS